MPREAQNSQQRVTRNALGLFSHPNHYGLPPGALWKAENCVIGREGVISKRRGFSRYGDALTNVPSAIFEFDQTLVVLDGSTLKYDSDGAGTWSAWSGSYSAPAADAAMRAIEANLNFYFTTDAGVYVNDATDGTPLRSGVPQGLDIQITSSHDGTGWMDPDGQVGYRIVWVKKDVNDNVKRGAPSQQVVYANQLYENHSWSRAGTTATVSFSGHGHSNGDTIQIKDSSDAATIPDGSYVISGVVAGTSYQITVNNTGATSGTLSDGEAADFTVVSTIPDDIVAGDEYELYRTEVSANDGTVPSDRHFQIWTAAVTSADITNGYISWVDTLDAGYLDAPLYTNDSQEGLAQANGRPPYCKYLATYEGHTFYANTKVEHHLELQFLDIAGLVDNTSSVTITSGATVETYTFSTAEDLANKKFQRHTGFSTTAENVEETMRSLCKVINRESAMVVCHYISGNDDAPGKILIQRRTLNATEFSVTCDASGTGDNFTPELPTSGTTVKSMEEAEKNVLYRSKYHQPEAVPALNKHKLGRANRGILGVAALKEGLIVFKEDGVFLISGETDGSAGATFAEDGIDPTVKIVAPGSLVLLDNAAICFTDQGVMKFTSSGSGILSRQIESEFSKVSKFSNFSTLTKAIGYESDRKFLLAVQEFNSDTQPELVWCYDYLTNAWTTWRKPIGGGLVLSSDQKLYLMHGDDKYVLQERKTYDTAGSDHIDEAIACTIGTAGGTTITITGWTYGTDPSEGWRITQGANATSITDVAGSGGSFTLTVQDATGFAPGAGELEMGYAMEVEWAPDSAGTPSVLKRFAICQVFTEIDGGIHKLAFRSDLQADFEWLSNITTTRTRGWGASPWGGAWGDEPPGQRTALRTFLPRDHQIGRSMSVKFKNVYAKQDVNLLLMALDVAALSQRTERL